MEDLINRQAAIKAICEDSTWLESQGCTDIWMAERKQRDVDILSDLPSAQPEIIRCKDCKHRYIKNDVWTCPFGLPSGPDGYCSWAERKEE